MDSLIEIVTDDILELILKFFPVVVLSLIVPPLIRFVFRNLNGDDYYSESEEIQKETTPKKEIESLAKIKTVNNTRTIPRRCPYCYGILDNVDCCPYCGTVF